MLPPYSVLMSVYCRENAIFLTQSLGSMVTQTYRPNEIVLVCDGAVTPKLEQAILRFAKQYPDLLQLVRLKKNKGLGEALNQGLCYCKNEYIVRMDTDDIALPNRAELQLKYMYEHQLDICGCTVLEFDDFGNEHIKKVPLAHRDILKYARRRNPFNHPSVVFKKSVILTAGGYQPMPFFEDYFLWIRVLQSGAISGNINEILLHMRSNKAFYKRRGGVSYSKNILVFWRQAVKLGFVGKFEAFLNIALRVPVAMLPNLVRESLYNFCLRGNDVN